MTGRRKGTPCACETDPCSCGSSKGKCIRAINNVSPDPNGDFNVNAGTGIIISGDENGIVIANGMPDPATIIAGDNIEITAIGDDLEIALTQDPIINGDLTVNGDIIQNGAAYETHAEHIYTADDYIIMRDGAISALSAGDYSGFQVKLYDGVNDGRLVIDNSGTARVGDVGDEQPLLTREESANLNNGALLKWDAGNSKAIDEGTVGNDSKPIKIVNGVATPVTNPLQTQLTPVITVLNPRNDLSGLTITKIDNQPASCRLCEYGNIAILNVSINISGTRSGSTDWFNLFPDHPWTAYYTPYMITTGSRTILNGDAIYIQNGQTYNENVCYQCIMIHQ